jgi:prevent-host-death family protein
MPDLFDKDTDTAGLHIRNIYERGRTSRQGTTEDSSAVQTEGGRRFAVIKEEQMQGADRIVPVTQAKRELLEIVKEMAEEDITITVTEGGVPVSVFMSAERYESLLETIEILADQRVVKALTRSSKEFKALNVMAHEDAWAKP